MGYRFVLPTADLLSAHSTMIEAATNGQSDRDEAEGYKHFLPSLSSLTSSGDWRERGRSPYRCQCSEGPVAVRRCSAFKGAGAPVTVAFTGTLRLEIDAASEC